MTNWHPDLSNSNAPRYIAIADSIETDLSTGRLSPGDRLPAQRHLAKLLGLDFTTVARGYTEARRRGLLSSQVGSGTFVTHPHDGDKKNTGGHSSRIGIPDFSMNLPPEPEGTALLSKMQSGFSALSSDLTPLLRYQSFETSEPDQNAAVSWLKSAGLTARSEQILFSPGAQAALTNILATLTAPGDQIGSEAITYPGIRSVCAQLHLELKGLETDEDGIIPDVFEAASRTGRLKALYLNPTLHNPTTRTVPYKRRRELVSIAENHGIPILEDDAYSLLSRTPPVPFATLAPEITWYVGSLSKCLGAGLRLAYVLAPDQGASWQFSRAVRTSQVMPSPLTVGLATRWIEDDTAAALLDQIRSESRTRQTIAANYLKDHAFLADPDGFHLWLNLPDGWNRSAFVSQMRNLQIGIVEADAFTVSGQPSEAVRIGLGGPINHAQLSQAMEIIAQTLQASPARASVYF
ncbi:DNA-binding transcriptional MocR family regulator [Labrenzia sp. EL_195]|nr:DNA-binding transcriptional MocR family regulator [Labrenzia sp. EL_195]